MKRKKKNVITATANMIYAMSCRMLEQHPEKEDRLVQLDVAHTRFYALARPFPSDLHEFVWTAMMCLARASNDNDVKDEERKSS